MKGIILAGGTGSRLYPLTKLVNKHLLPVGKSPMIGYGIERLRSAGITDLLFVIGKLSAALYIDYIGSGKHMGIRVGFVIQDGAGGIAQALALTEPFLAKGEKFVVLLGDNLFVDDLNPYVQQFIEQEYGEARVMLKRVHDPRRYGVPVFYGDGLDRILRIEEKPKRPQSDYCVTGIYMYDTSVFEYIKMIKPSARGEMEITDVNNLYAAHGKLRHSMLQGWWTDAGTFDSLQEASLKLKGVQL
ncbi:sugar phosphate nucleotidyltransferase [Paenibacillus marinisediminis]